MMKKKLLARSVVLGLLCAGVFGTSALATPFVITDPASYEFYNQGVYGDGIEVNGSEDKHLTFTSGAAITSGIEHNSTGSTYIRGILTYGIINNHSGVLKLGGWSGNALPPIRSSKIINDVGAQLEIQAFADFNFNNLGNYIQNDGTMIFSNPTEISGDRAVVNNGTMKFIGLQTDISGTSSLTNVPDGMHDNYSSIENNGVMNIESKSLDIDNHHAMAINNTGTLTINSNNFFIGTDFCCDDHSSNNEPADGHIENPAKYKIINNSGVLRIDGGIINNSDYAQLIQGKIVHEVGATTDINLYGVTSPSDLAYIISNMQYSTHVPFSGFIGNVEGSSDSGFSISLNSTACWMAGKQSEVVNSLSLNGGAVVVGDLKFIVNQNSSGQISPNMNMSMLWPDSYKTLKIKKFNSNGEFYDDYRQGNFGRIEGIYVFTDLKNNQSDRIVFLGETPNKTIPLGIINKDDSNGRPIVPSDGHRVVVITAPANTQMTINPSLLVYGKELSRFYREGGSINHFNVYSPVLETELVDGTADGIDGQALNWVFTGWGSSNVSKTPKKESDQHKDGFDLNATELDNTLKRINDIRTDPSEVGVWLRGESGKMKIRSYSYDYNLMSGGYDWDFDSNAAKMFLGFGISYAKNDCDTGIIGNTKSMGYNLYGSWLGKANKDYVDVIVKYGTLDKDYAGLDDNNVFVKGDYDKNLFSIAAKYGRRIDREDGWYLEPSVGLIWGRIGSADYTDSQGIKIHADSSTSKMASLGVQVGKNVKGTEYYGKFEVRHDFDGKMHVSIPDSNLPGSSVYDDMGGTWYKVGIGAVRKIDKNNSFYIDIEKDFGNKVKKPYSIGAGYRYTW